MSIGLEAPTGLRPYHRVVDAKPTKVTVKATVSAGSLQDAVVKVFPDSFTYIKMHP